MANSLSTSDIDLHDPETLHFDDSPGDFVLLDVTPIVFTVRGVKHFTPRFAHLGVALASLKTAEDFQAALVAWTMVESQMLGDYIRGKAASSNQATEMQALVAILDKDDAELQRLTAKIEHKKRASVSSTS